MSESTWALLSDGERMIRESARAVAMDVVARTAGDRDRSGAWPRDELASVAGLGFLGMHIPAEFGGSRLSFVEYILALEEFACADAGFASILHVHNSMGDLISRFGTADQKARWLPDLASGRRIGACLLTEPHAGSDTSAYRTTAVRDDRHYILNGSKQYISNGSEAGCAVVVAGITETRHGRTGASLFIVDPSTPGYDVLRVEDKMGQRSAHIAAIGLHDCRVPAENLIGGEGTAYERVLSMLSEGRIAVGAVAVGTARAALDAAVQYSRERTAYGKPIQKLQGVSFDLADMATQVEVARQFVMHVARLRSANLPCVTEASMAKLFASEMAERVCSDALQLHGGYGYIAGTPVERYYRDVRVTKIYEGTSHIQKVIIARGLL